jgi:formimidoylglutamate deiminase
MQTAHQIYFAKAVKTKAGWQKNQIIEINEKGQFSNIRPAIHSDQQNPNLRQLKGFVLPTVPNLHSHSFQRLMAGRAEYTTASKDHFWTWRELMYRIANDMSLEAIQITTQMLYIELMKGGYGGIVEFHYLHHDNQSNTTTKNTTALIAQAIIKTAQSLGFPLTMVPALYRYSQFGKQPPRFEQRRFVYDWENFENAVFALQNQISKTQNHAQTLRTRLGLAGHSLRACDLEDFHRIVDLANRLDSQFAKFDDLPMPLHLHVAEQMGEIEACLKFSGKRPVALFDDEIGLSSRWTCVHATHLDQDEIERLAHRQATVALCPSTEGNLGDGFFQLPNYLKVGGRFGIGSDSEICTSVAQELRLIEYVQRLATQRRGASAMHLTEAVHIGDFLFDQCTQISQQSFGQATASIEIGHWADFMLIDDDNEAFWDGDLQFMLDHWVFHPKSPAPHAMMLQGKWVIQDGLHALESETKSAFKALIKSFYSHSQF